MSLGNPFIFGIKESKVKIIRHKKTLVLVFGRKPILTFAARVFPVAQPILLTDGFLCVEFFTARAGVGHSPLESAGFF